MALFFLSADEKFAPSPTGVGFPEVIDVVIDDNDTLWALGRDGQLMAFAVDTHPSIDSVGIPTAVAAINPNARRLFLVGGQAWASAARLIPLSLVDGQIDTDDRGAVVPHLAGLGKVGATLIGVTEEGGVVHINESSRAADAPRATGVSLLGNSTVVTAFDADEFYVVGLVGTDKAGRIGVVRCSEFACDPVDGLEFLAVPADVEFVGGATLTNDRLLVTFDNHVATVSRATIAATTSGPVTPIDRSIALSLGDRFAAPLVIGNCAYIARQGNGSDADTGILAIDQTTFNVFPAHDGPGDGEVDLLFMDGAQMVGTGKSGAFFLTDEIDSSDCILEAPAVTGPRRSVWTLEAAAPHPDGVVVGDIFGTLWLSHVR